MERTQTSSLQLDVFSDLLIISIRVMVGESLKERGESLGEREITKERKEEVTGLQ